MIPGLLLVKIIGVTDTMQQFVHFRTYTIVTSCSQTHALRVIRTHGLPAEPLFKIYRGVVSDVVLKTKVLVSRRLEDKK